MHALVRTIFARLHSLDPVAEEAKLQINDDDPQEGEIKLTVSGSAIVTDSGERADETTAAEKSIEDGEIPATTDKETKPETAHQDDPLSATPKPECRFACPFEFKH